MCGLSSFCSSKVMDTQAQIRIPAWIDGGYVFTLNSFLLIMFDLESHLNSIFIHSYFYFVPVFLKGTRSALALRDVSTDSDTVLQNLDALLTWVCEIEELTANQKPPSSEVKVVKAQLQEQKVCYRQKNIFDIL